MARLVKMSLMGIRNFGPVYDIEQSEQIAFGPITLLVGQNGCGKTTVLEALKFICTGDLPPGTNNGRGFVHDPKICGKRECMGQIKLHIKSSQGDDYIITKSMKVEQKPTNMSFSRLDSSIQIKNTNGELKEISSRNTDIDRYCTDLLNVPQSIFNSVLFCHQEHALWPLDEGKKVKEKFDEIFDSTKYNKCMEMLRKYVKDKTTELKMLTVEVQGFKEKYESVQKEQIRLNDRKDRLLQTNERILAKIEAMEPTKNKLREILDIEKKISVLDKEHNSLLSKKDAILRIKEIYGDQIKSFFEGNDDELNETIVTFENHQKEKEKVIIKLEEHKQILEEKQKENNQAMQKHQVQLGQLKRDYEQYEHKKEQRKKLLQEAERIFSVENIFTQEMLEDIQNIVDKLRDLNKKSDNDFVRLEESKKQEENSCQQELGKVRESMATLKEKILATNKSFEIKQAESNKIENELLNMSISSNKIKAIEKRIQDNKRTLAGLEAGMNEKNTETEIKQTKEFVETLENKLKDLEQLDRLLQENQITEEKIEIEQQQKIQKKNEMQQILSKHKLKLLSLLGNNYEQKNLENKVKSILREKEDFVKKVNVKIEKTKREVLTFENSVKHQEKELKQKEEDISLKRKKINNFCKDKELTIYIQEVQARKETFQKKKGQFSSGKVMYEAFIEQFEKEHPECPVCKTNFAGKETMIKNVILDLKKQIHHIPEKLAEVETSLRKDEKLFTDLQQLVPLDKEIQLSTGVLSSIRENLEKNRVNLEKSTEELKNLQNQIIEPEKIIQDCRALVGDLARVDQFYRDIDNSEINIAKLTNQLKEFETSKSKVEVESEIDNIKSDLKNNRNKIEDLNSKLNRHRTSCQKIKNTLNSLMQEKLEIEKKMGNQQNLEDQIKQLKIEMENLQVDSMEFDEDLRNLNNKLKELEENKRALLKRNSEIIAEKRKENARKQKYLDSITSINSEISIYENSNISAEIETQIEKIAEYKSKDDSYSNAKNKAVQEITNLKEFIAKQESELKNLHDNVRLREKQVEEIELDAEIEASSRKMGNYSKDTIMQEKREHSLQLEKMEKEIAKLKGTADELQQVINELEQELAQPVNRNALKNYRDKVYQYSLLELSMKDLNKYIAIFEKSILDFHSERMKQINRRIRSLWRAIYKGNDIDYIEIRTENTTGSSKRRSYDYKVMMAKRDDKQMEMRGRCSAGQRVLACLVIRIALAELFSTNCGIMALDEPTTNLDQQNIESLSLGLAELINSRKDFKNFQLLIITHDQDFIESLRHNLQISAYHWTIYRDNDGLSRITREV